VLYKIQKTPTQKIPPPPHPLFLVGRRTKALKEEERIHRSKGGLNLFFLYLFCMKKGVDHGGGSLKPTNPHKNPPPKRQKIFWTPPPQNFITVVFDTPKTKDFIDLQEEEKGGPDRRGGGEFHFIHIEGGGRDARSG